MPSILDSRIAAIIRPVVVGDPWRSKGCGSDIEPESFIENTPESGATWELYSCHHNGSTFIWLLPKYHTHSAHHHSDLCYVQIVVDAYCISPRLRPSASARSAHPVKRVSPLGGRRDGSDHFHCRCYHMYA